MDDVLIGLIVVACIGGWVITTAIRARHGYPVEDFLGFKDHKTGLEHDKLKAMLEAEIALRDERIAQLEQRVQVLERIATDRTAHLAEEIEQLRSRPVL